MTQIGEQEFDKVLQAARERAEVNDDGIAWIKALDIDSEAFSEVMINIARAGIKVMLEGAIEEAGGPESGFATLGPAEIESMTYDIACSAFEIGFRLREEYKEPEINPNELK